jgi:flagellar protein FliJ
VSAIDSLVRLHRWQLDERRRQIADLEQLAVKLRQEQQRLTLEQKSEQAVTESSTEALSAYAAYARRLIERRQKLELSLASVEQQVAAAREALADAFQEVKRYEIAAAHRLAQQRKRLDQQQQRVLDEIGIEAFRRGGGR